ncbi:MAG: fructosamine kinase family protein [Cocleimonas sp.]|nr:fructosamine kinase family protein [Cocleimonas sp.]
MNGKGISHTKKLITIAENMSDTLQKSVQFKQIESINGGCINQVSKVSDEQGNQWLIKENNPQLLDMFIAEAHGLNEIRKSQTIRCPTVVCYGATQQSAYLVMEYIVLSQGAGDALTGKKLAQMHAYQSKIHGWHSDNTIGTTPQSNHQSNSWSTFWKKQRLMPQLERAKKKGYASRDYDNGIKLSEQLAVFFSDYQPPPSLLHGDLWGGNQAHDEQGHPVIFDPAVYYGDRETDLAMTELFGGFNASFYAAYNEYYPLDVGYSIRKTLYNLYHTLNHYNLFGGGYASQAASMTNKLLAEL